MLSIKQTKKDSPHRQADARHDFLMTSNNEVLIERRPPTGIWGGLWSLPEIATDADTLAIAKSRYGVATMRGRKPIPLDPMEHGFTHYSLTIYPLEIAVSKREPRAAEAGIMWLNLDDIHGAALPAPVKKILRRLLRKA